MIRKLHFAFRRSAFPQVAFSEIRENVVFVSRTPESPRPQPAETSAEKPALRARLNIPGRKYPLPGARPGILTPADKYARRRPKAPTRSPPHRIAIGNAFHYAKHIIENGYRKRRFA